MPTEVVPPPPAPQPAPPPRRRRGRNFLIILLLLIAAFLGGYIPQWLEVRQQRGFYETTSLELRLVKLHDSLGQAALEAQRNNYANASIAAVTFFDDCAAIARTNALEAEPRTQTALLGYTAQRDQIMALIANADPAARDRLAGMYFALQGVLERRIG